MGPNLLTVFLRRAKFESIEGKGRRAWDDEAEIERMQLESKKQQGLPATI